MHLKYKLNNFNRANLHLKPNNTLIMDNRKLIIGIATGISTLTLVGVLLMRDNKSKKRKSFNTFKNPKNIFKEKLKMQSPKTTKEFKNAVDEGEEFTSNAKKWVTHWAKKTGSSF